MTSTKPVENLPNVPTLVPWATKLSIPLRTKFFLAGTLFPVLCLTAIVFGARTGAPESPWQSGAIKHHVVVLLSFPSIAAFFPVSYTHLTLPTTPYV